MLLRVKYKQHSSCNQSVLLFPQEKIAGDESAASDGAKFQLFQKKGGAFILLYLFVPTVTPSSLGSCPGSHTVTVTVTVLLAQGESSSGSLGRSPKKAVEAVFS